MLYRIRWATSQRAEKHQLEGIVELYDIYFWKPKIGGKHGRRTKKTKVLAKVSKTEDGKPRYIKMQVVPNLKSTTIARFVNKNIDQGTKIETDAYRCYHKPLVDKYKHQYDVFDANSDLLTGCIL